MMNIEWLSKKYFVSGFFLCYSEIDILNVIVIISVVKLLVGFNVLMILNKL